MSTFERCFNGILLFAMINFAWITFLEAYIPLIGGNIVGIAAAAALVIWGPRPGGKNKE